MSRLTALRAFELSTPTWEMELNSLLKTIEISAKVQKVREFRFVGGFWGECHKTEYKTAVAELRGLGYTVSSGTTEVGPGFGEDHDREPVPTGFTLVSWHNPKV